uniref:5-aminolevulinate synthase n=1 Tax=Echinococcus granulosus TaxID=6210 RepID=A0A068WYN3_ECHGR|nr:5 aminolevulinate synthase [Echinococcus granulosus]
MRVRVVLTDLASCILQNCSKSPGNFSRPRRLTHTAVLANDQLPFPPVCDGLEKCVLGQCPYSMESGNPQHQKERKDCVDAFVPTTCALYPCKSAQSMPPPPRSTCSQLSGMGQAIRFDYSSFFEEQLEKKRATATYRVFRRILRDANHYPFAEDFSTGRRQTINVWCSNDYLGMSRHPMVLESARNAINRFGIGSGGTRNISGNTLLHEALEHELADLHGKEAGLVFTSCFVANEAAIYTLGTLIPGLKIFSDAGNHASLIHGIRTSRAPKYIYRENDAGHLDELMQQQSTPREPKLAVCETVHSMNGSIVPLREFLDVCEDHNALTFVDEVHAVGLYGEYGGGVAEELGCMHRIDAITGTLGKAFGSLGGYLVGGRALIDMVRSYAGGLIFTTSLPPPVLAAARASVAILKSAEGQDLRAEHRRRVDFVRRRLQEAGLPVADVPSHIIPISVGNAKVCTSISEALLFNHQIYLQSINYPTVAKGTERLRLAPSPFHTDAMTDHLVDSLVKVWRSHNLPLKH